MRHFGCDYFFNPFGRGFGHFGPPRPGFDCRPWERPGHCGDRPDFGPWQRPGHFGDRPDFGPWQRPGHCPNKADFGPWRGPFGPHKRPHFGPEECRPCGHGRGPFRGPGRDSDGEGPSDFEGCRRRAGGPHRRPHFGPAGDGFRCGPFGHHKRHFGPDRDSDGECGPDFGHCHRRGPPGFGPWGRRGPGIPGCGGDSFEPRCKKCQAAEDTGNEDEGRRCRKQKRPCSSKNKDDSEGNDTVLIQRIIVEKVPRSSSV